MHGWYIGYKNSAIVDKMADGLLAQLVEHIVHIDGVTGSSPVQTTKNRPYGAVFFCIFAYRRSLTQPAIPIFRSTFMH